MEKLILLLDDLEKEPVLTGKSMLLDFFSLFFDEMHDKSTSEFNRKKDILSYKISVLLDTETYREIIIIQTRERLSFSRARNDYDEIIISALVSSKTNEAISVLKEILQSESDVFKCYIFYHNVSYPIPKIFQTEECKYSIVNFINSKNFYAIYDERRKRPGLYSDSFAFPSSYISCFELKEFDHIKNQRLNPSQLSKMASKSRLESIGLINDHYFKLEIILCYFNSLPTLYKSRFVKLVNKTYPELKLKKNGHYVYARYL